MAKARGDDGLLLYGPLKPAGRLPSAETIKARLSCEARRQAAGKGRFSPDWKGRVKRAAAGGKKGGAEMRAMREGGP